MEIEGLKVEIQMRGWWKCRWTSLQVQMMTYSPLLILPGKRDFKSRNVLGHWYWEEFEKGRLKTSLVGLTILSHTGPGTVYLHVWANRSRAGGFCVTVTRTLLFGLLQPLRSKSPLLRLSEPTTCAEGTGWYSYGRLLVVLVPPTHLFCHSSFF